MARAAASAVRTAVVICILVGVRWLDTVFAAARQKAQALKFRGVEGS